MKPERIHEEFYGNFFDILRSKHGFEIIRNLAKGAVNTRACYLVKKDDELSVIKFHFNDRVEGKKQTQNEISILEDLKDTSGIVQLFGSDKEIVQLGNAYMGQGDLEVSYVRQGYVPGKRLGNVEEITQEMAKYMLETMDEVHKKGYAYENELNLNDFVLDENNRPILVDLEFARKLSRIPIVKQFMAYDDKLILKSKLEYKTLGCTKGL